MSHSIYSSPLLACVQKLVQERPANLLLKDLAAEMNVTPVWLGGFANGQFNNPSAVVIEKLYIRLTGKQLVGDCVPKNTD